LELYVLIFLVTALLVPTDVVRLTLTARAALLSLPWMLLLYLAGARWQTGNDWNSYFDYYTDLEAIDDYAGDFEIGYRMLAWLVKTAGLPYGGFLFVSAVVYMSCFYLAFRRQRGAMMLILLFYCTYLLGWMGTARQVIALGLTACAGECLLERRRIAFVALVALATTFHQTAILFLVAPLLNRPLRSPQFYLFVVFLASILGQLLLLVVPGLVDSLSGVQGLGDKVVLYSRVGADELNHELGSTLGVLWYVKRLVFLILFLAVREKFDTPRLAFYFNAYVASVVFFLLLNPVLPILAIRGSNYFSIYELFLLSALVTTRGRFAALVIPFLVVLSAQRLYTGLYAYHPDLFIPYKGLFINEELRREMY
jgi:hypothetical protein